jgi:hypothetical protein
MANLGISLASHYGALSFVRLSMIYCVKVVKAAATCKMTRKLGCGGEEADFALVSALRSWVCKLCWQGSLLRW